MTKAATLRNPLARLLRNVVLGTAGRSSALTMAIATRLTGIGDA